MIESFYDIAGKTAVVQRHIYDDFQNEKIRRVKLFCLTKRYAVRVFSGRERRILFSCATFQKSDILYNKIDVEFLCRNVLKTVNQIITICL